MSLAEPTRIEVAAVASVAEPRRLSVACSSSAWGLLLAALAGWLASFTLTVERFKLFVDSDYRPSCSINPILSCGSVMATPQAAVLGFPNPIIGVVAFSVVIPLALLSVARIALPQWIWIGLWVGTACGVGFVCWLIFQTLYRIHALCPYCMVVWAVVTPMLAVLSNQLREALPRPIRAIVDWRWTVVALFCTAVVLQVFLAFQDYWLSLI
ncbi:vitamin K epoxide reductase family protein [Nocardia brasiliensis]|uniref:vitamin K epoxide reductase family protein n=1 Tax=Nocardia brasiliensis TaxID=37326 RepID=UPI002453FC4C|nr:vitamin K epoxide reductase family protein [Nocardia brasiliensis]